jgi:CHAD domain-containing protein
VPDAHELEPFRALLTAHRRTAHTTLNRSLRSARFRRLVEYWGSDLALAGDLGPDGKRPVGEVADARLARAWRRVEKRGNAITADSPADDLHDLRKRCKELRYLLEFFAGLYDAAAHKTIVTELKKLQDNLGEFQDAESQRHLVRDHAEELGEQGAAAGTLLALGRLEEHLEHRQHTARDEFAARWKRFDRPRNRRLFEGLVSG